MPRGAYDIGELRLRLMDRPSPETWTPFESALFTLVTLQGDRNGERRYFSERLRVVQAMLEAYDGAMEARG